MIKHSNRTIQLCPRCHVNRDERTAYVASKSRTIEKTRMILNQYWKKMHVYKQFQWETSRRNNLEGGSTRDA